MVKSTHSPASAGGTGAPASALRAARAPLRAAPPDPAAQPAPLTALEAGVAARVVRVAADPATARHLAALGVRAGALLDLVRNLGPQGVVIGLAEDRLALPRSVAGVIHAVVVGRPVAAGDGRP
jgi:Fe2+ transport system protein FeoA